MSAYIFFFLVSYAENLSGQTCGDGELLEKFILHPMEKCWEQNSRSHQSRKKKKSIPKPSVIAHIPLVFCSKPIFLKLAHCKSRIFMYDRENKCLFFEHRENKCLIIDCQTEIIM